MVQPNTLLALTVGECEALTQHETAIERGLTTFYEVGSALLAIRDARLYRAEHGTFEDYCRERWGMTRMRASQLIAASEAFGNVNHGLQPPANERQIRPLTQLGSPEQQREAWGLAQNLAAQHTPDGKVTASFVEIAVAHVKDPEKVLLCRETYAPAVAPAPAAPSVPPAPPPSPPLPAPAPPAPSAMAVHFSSDTPEWYTPPHVVAAVINFFDAIDLDPCSNSHETPAIPAGKHYTAADDGLASPWFGRVYMNPPYGREIGQWVERASRAYEAREIEAALLLVPARPDTAWFRRLGNYTVCFIAGRLTFIGSDGTDNPAPFPSALVYLGDEVGRFAAGFESLGHVYRRVGA